jgi:hypothetical protein
LLDKRRSQRVREQVEQHLQALDEHTTQWYRGQVIKSQQENILFELEIEGGSIGVTMATDNDFFEMAKNLQQGEQVLLIGSLQMLDSINKDWPQIHLKASLIVKLN